MIADEALKKHKAEKLLTIIDLLNQLTDEERYTIFCMFCTSCGSNKLPCTCMRDD